MTGALLDIRGLEKTFALGGRGPFRRASGTVRAVAGVDLSVFRGETLALVGESGSGKTTLARAATHIDPPSAGSVLFDGHDLSALRPADRRALRRHIQFIHQDPYGTLNPRLTVGTIIAEPLVIHDLGTEVTREERVFELLDAVGLSAADIDRYPHEFSGGQRQRIAIARALAPRPSLVIADEPVSALDASIRSQILNLLMDLRRRNDLTYLFIGHDLPVVRHIADRVAVMHAGRIVEIAPTEMLFEDPRHPYTRMLLAAAPVVGHGKRRPGAEPPTIEANSAGCPFTRHCRITIGACFQNPPWPEPLIGAPIHRVACHRRDEGTEG